MKFNFRKIASVFASVVMLGSTIGIAAAANYPAPFVSGGSANVAVVYGTNAAFSDGLAAGDLQTNLQAELAKQTATGGTTSGASASGGDAINLATTSQKLYMNSALNAARTVLTKDHMPTLLADGTATDNSGTQYKYTQTISVLGGNRKITFDKSGESMDPTLYVDTGYQSTDPFYNYTLTFSKTLNVSDPTIIGTATLNILGQDYTVGANSDYQTLYLYGSGSAATVTEGETKTVKVGDVEHTVLLVGTSSATSATIEVDGVRKTVTKGNSYKFAGDFQVYVKDLFDATKTGTLSSVDVLLGAKTLHLANGQAVRYGSDDSTITGTTTKISGTNGQGITGFTVAQAAESATGDFLKAGDTYTDRVFGGLQVEMVGGVPPLDDASRDKIVVDTDNSVSARVTFTSALAGTVGEKQLAFARDGDLAANTVIKMNLANDANKTIHVVENETAVVGDWIVVNDNDEGRILEVLSIGAGSSANDYTRLRDVITKDDFDFSTGVNNYTTAARTIGGAEYNMLNIVNADSSKSTTQLTWGANSGVAKPGDSITIFPRVKLQNGEWLSFMRSGVTLTNATTYSLPGLQLYSSYKTGQQFLTATVGTIGAATNEWAFGNVNYSVTGAAATTANVSATLNGLAIPGSGTITGCNLNGTEVYGAAVLISEEKTLASTDGYSICVPLKLVTSGSTKMPGVDTAASRDTVLSLKSLQSNSYISQGVDTFGTLVQADVSTGTNGAATITVPNDQMYVDVLFKAPGATVTPGSNTGGNVAEIGNVIVKDSELSQVSTKNLVVVGGSCVNTVAAKILGSATPLCGAEFTTAAGVSANQALVKAVDAATAGGTAGKIALLVAGYEAADTTKAVKWVTTEKPATDAGTVKTLSTSSTVATVVTTTGTTA